jgi:hypothetical protein
MKLELRDKEFDFKKNKGIAERENYLLNAF